MKPIHEVGTRKKATARATLTEGKGVVRINSQLLDNYSTQMYKDKIKEPLQIAGETASKVDIQVSVSGGGMSSQSNAIRIAVSKVLAEHNKKLRQQFLDYDRTLLVPDVRQRESRKPNTHGKARSKRQKSYR